MQDESLPGAQLRRAREEKGISRDEVSRSLHLSRNYLIALENDEYGKLPEPAFIKGYLRNYARLLGLPGEEVAAQYQQRLDRERVSAEEHQAETEERRRVAVNSRWRLPALIVLVIILILVVGWWLWPNHGAMQTVPGDTGQSQSESVTPPNASTDGVGASAATVSQGALGSQGASQGAQENTQGSAQENAPASPAAGGGDEAAGQAGAPATGADSSASAGVTDGSTATGNAETGAGATMDNNGAAAGNSDTAADNSAAAGDGLNARSAATASAETGEASTGQTSEAAPVAAASGSLAVAFSRLCWIKVVDSTGKTLAVGTQQADTAMDLNGKSPFRVTIGDAGAVSSVVVNGKQARLPSQQSGEVIHVTLP